MDLTYVNTLGVHDGVFHADDVFCGAMVRLCNPSAKIIRTRDENLLSACDLIADVGMGEYDHHQKDAKIRESDIKYCSASLLWEDFGKEIIHVVLSNWCVKEVYDSISDEIIDKVKTKIDKTVLITIDANDNGQRVLREFTPEEFDTIHFDSLPSIIASYNLPESDFDDQTNYELAVRFAITFLKEAIIAYTSLALDSCLDGPIFKYLEGLDDILRDLFILSCKPILHSVDASKITPKEIIENFSQQLLTYFTGDSNITADMVDKLTPKMIKRFSDNVDMEEIYYNFLNLKNPDITFPTADFVFSVMKPVNALPFYKEYLSNIMLKLIYTYRCERDIEVAYDIAINNSREYIVLDRCIPWKEKLLELDPTHKIKFVIYGVNDGAEYRGQGVPLSLTDQTCVLYYPEAWRAKRNEELSEISGIPNCVFCHVSGFLCINKSLQGMIAMTKKVLSQESQVQGF